MLSCRARGAEHYVAVTDLNNTPLIDAMAANGMKRVGSRSKYRTAD